MPINGFKNESLEIKLTTITSSIQPTDSDPELVGIVTPGKTPDI